MKTMTIRDAAGDRWNFQYGIRTTNHSYFALTGEMTPKRCRRPVSAGCLHEDFVRLFPELAYLVRWHLCSEDGTPKHYESNAQYWLAEADKHYRMDREGDYQKALSNFRETVVWGALSEDEETALERRRLGCFRSLMTQEPASIQKWLQERLPRLQEAFRADMARAGVALASAEWHTPPEVIEAVRKAGGCTIELTRCSFCVPLTDVQWIKLTRLDHRGDEVYSCATGHEHSAIRKLMAAGCQELEWNGHFGRNLFFSCDVEKIRTAKEAIRKFVEAL